MVSHLGLAWDRVTVNDIEIERALQRQAKTAKGKGDMYAAEYESFSQLPKMQ
ncbi:hypothetical protein EYZ11_000915 [Aspergillus tanneri]|uniref:Uncharacterized protein n=1 Tax=Aspergillus tanneri TaxID=1220188 RepID=A0A4S3JW10_9EURO|nr:hypothetical protein EYZ11_000915 [Aspergillus tanneri]